MLSVQFTTLVTAILGTGTTLAQKRGLAYNEGLAIDGFGGPGNHVSWQYNWDSNTDLGRQYIEYVPMLWGLTPVEHVTVWADRAAYWIEAGTRHLLSFNEPDHGGQAGLDVGTAVAAHTQHMSPFASSAKIGSPAVTNGGFWWLQEFLAQCDATPGCVVDFVAVHWYNPAWMVDDLKNWIDSICAISGGREVWLTEFKGEGSPDQQIDMLNQVLPWMDNHPCLARYAYFGTAWNDKGLLIGNGPDLSAVGAVYGYSG